MNSHEPPRPRRASRPLGRAAPEPYEVPELDFDQLAHEFERVVDLVAAIERGYQCMQEELSSAQRTVEQLRREQADAATRTLRLEARVLTLLRRSLGEQGIAALVEQLEQGETDTTHPSELELRLLHVLEGD
jgi:chromosome segregation ATPase